jgi:hypothetical protein
MEILTIVGRERGGGASGTAWLCSFGKLIEDRDLRWLNRLWDRYLDLLLYGLSFEWFV